VDANIFGKERMRDRRTGFNEVGWLLVTAVVVFCLSLSAAAAQPRGPGPSAPKVGDIARDFVLQTMGGQRLRLSDELARGPLVLVVLRGWPGYQCPFCTRQFGDYLRNAERFASRSARVLFVYPGPAEGLSQHAVAFTGGKPMPAAFRILVDPDYTFTNAYGLRWNAPEETAYPSTFVLGADGKVAFAHISGEHGDRVSAEVALKALATVRP
jgi:peroxiredoxin